MCISVYIKPTTRGKATEAVEAQTGKVTYLRWPSKWKSQESNLCCLIAKPIFSTAVVSCCLCFV